MIANKFANPLLRTLILQPSFLFSVKKKQLELTLRTPYRTCPSIEKPLLKILQAFRK
jgi:hypothetical protein